MQKGKKKKVKNVWQGAALPGALQSYGLADSAKALEVAQRLLDAGFISSEVRYSDWS